MNRRHLLLAGGAAALLPAAASATARPVLTVSATRAVGFKTVTEALNAVPETGGATIQIAPGNYREKLVISKPDVHLVGTGERSFDTIIVWDDSSLTTKVTGQKESATVTVLGDGFQASNIAFQNDYHLTHPNAPSQAPAVKTVADRAVYDTVCFFGAQDTLFADSKDSKNPARQYFKGCYVEGHVDFIFGNARAFFDHCHIHMIQRDTAYITAQSNNTPGGPSAYVFDHCNITSDTAAPGLYLGRAWRPYAQVVFLDTQIDCALNPEGWHEWTPGKTETYKTAYFAEYNSTGLGAKPSARVPWSHQLNKADAEKWRLANFFQDRSWIGTVV
jgi:pectinesterase